MDGDTETGDGVTIDLAAAELTSRLSAGLHDLANVAGELARQIREEGVTVDADARLTLDQAHSNATSIARTLEELGFR